MGNDDSPQSLSHRTSQHVPRWCIEGCKVISGEPDFGLMGALFRECHAPCLLNTNVPQILQILHRSLVGLL